MQKEDTFTSEAHRQRQQFPHVLHMIGTSFVLTNLTMKVDILYAEDPSPSSHISSITCTDYATDTDEMPVSQLEQEHGNPCIRQHVHCVDGEASSRSREGEARSKSNRRAAFAECSASGAEEMVAATARPSFLKLDFRTHGAAVFFSVREGSQKVS